MRSGASANAITRAEQLLRDVSSQKLDETTLERVSIALAELLLELTRVSRTTAERTRETQLARLMHDESGQVFTTCLTDRVYRSADPDLVVDAARQLLRRLGVPRYFSRFERTQLQLLLRAGPFVPQLTASMMLRKLRDETRHVVLSAQEPALSEHLSMRRSEGTHVNLNYLGEAVLGEREAAERCDGYVALLARPDVEAISVKLSSITSQLELLSFRDTIEQLKPRLLRIYRAALSHRFVRPDGSAAPKLVTLDMEAYRDLALTFELFTQLLDLPELQELRACLVLQAYLPDAFMYQRELTAFARRRTERGAAPTRLRIVKGANLAAEGCESALRGWPRPNYDTKLEVDANYKAMLEYACQPEHARSLHIGLASHNLFDVGFGLVLRAQHGLGPELTFELLEGMADPLRRALEALQQEVLVYCPIVAENSMQTAIAYLTRRLDENTAPENFLRNSFGMRVGDPSWQAERARFSAALQQRKRVDHAPRRVQDRQGSDPPARSADSGRAFSNEPDTDFALAQNRAWLASALERLRTRDCFDVAMQIGGKRTLEGTLHAGFDPSRPGFCPYRHPLANAEQLELALATAARAAHGFATSSITVRDQLLTNIARELRAARGELIAAMVLDAGKRADQADAEVSEAIDFAEYYRRSYREHAARPELALTPKGVVLVTPPWNFPLAIPVSGTLAALMAGNAVILKPALETPFVAERFADVCYRAGVSSELLQLVFCRDELGSRLISDERVTSVVLTGATSTARKFHELRPGLDLMAETGGKNSLIVSALADRDLAIKELLASAFGHAGQKCSAASLLICVAEVYDSPNFKAVLQDAVASLTVGSAWDARSQVTPLIQPPQGALLHALRSLDAEETWLVEPKFDADNPRLVSPGVKWDVAPSSATHLTELFGPVLGALRARDLEHAIALANSTPYGLTAGLFSLDEREQALWAERLRAGNLYVNRAITGAIVQRQPFGGCKASSFGPGAKAGGPNYVLQLCHVTDRAGDESTVQAPLPDAATFLARVRNHITPVQQERLARAACHYAHAFRSHFAHVHDPSRVLGERNEFRYRACAPLLVRASADGELQQALLACVAALTAGAQLCLSVDPDAARQATWLLELPLCCPSVESAEAAAARLGTGVERVRQIGAVEPAFEAAALKHGVHIAREPVLLAGRVELLHYTREQVLSNAYHRYGNLQGGLLLPGA